MSLFNIDCYCQSTSTLCKALLICIVLLFNLLGTDVLVLSKGQSVSGYYRLMTKKGGWIWMLTKGNIVYSNTSFQPQYIININYVVRYADKYLGNIYCLFEYWPLICKLHSIGGGQYIGVCHKFSFSISGMGLACKGKSKEFLLYCPTPPYCNSRCCS